jgi:outer membrane protein OmpA-like peptidoglycan-associated protein
VEREYFSRTAVCFAWLILVMQIVMCASADRQEIPDPVFGKKDDAIFTFRGVIYAIPEASQMIPDLISLNPIGLIYIDSLNIPNQKFDSGFPGVTDRIEWFAIDYTGYFYIKNTGKYFFRLTSDDGSRLFVDDREIVNNDGGHPAQTKEGTAEMVKGLHRIHVQYYQGPRFHIALVLEISETGDEYKVFRISDYMPAKVTTRGKQTEIVLGDELLFDFNKTDLNEGSKKVLDDIVRYYLKRDSYRMLVIGGHSDDIGTDEQNLTISLRRAENVRMYLISQGFDGRKITAKGYGKTKPRHPNNSDGNRAANRRIELILVK